MTSGSKMWTWRLWLIVAGVWMAHSAVGQPGARPGRERLGPEVNTEDHDESAPVISPDGYSLYFWSLGRPGGFGIQDIFVSRWDSLTKRWQPADNLGTPVNDPTANIPFSITPEGTRLLVYRQARRPGESDLMLARKEGVAWNTGNTVRIQNYANQAGAALTAFLASDGITLLLSMATPTSKGEDLFVSFYNRRTGVFSPPKRLPDLLNTEGADITPSLAPDGVTLYFSSTGQPGGAPNLGGTDIYMARRLDDTWQAWTRPVNLGPRVNTPAEDYYFRLAPDAIHGFLVSTYQSATKDIWRATLPPEVRPRPVLEVRGVVRDTLSGKPIHASLLYQDLDAGTDLGVALTDSLTNEFRLLLPSGRRYGFVAEAEGYLSVSAQLDVRVPVNQSRALVRRDLSLAPLRVGQRIPLNNLFFATGRSVLTPASTPELERLVRGLKDYPASRIEISGHTDNVGTPERNLALSRERAEAVASRLSTLGLDASRVDIVAQGDRLPIAPNTTAAGRARNRRVEVRIVAL